MPRARFPDPPRIFVIGYMGSDRKTRAKMISAMDGYMFFDLDQMIEQKEGMSIREICRAKGEHEYRNKEYHALKFLSEENDIVVSCGDGIVLDEDCRNILRQNRVIFVKENLRKLWERAKKDANLPYAFLSLGDEEFRYKKFCSLYEIRKSLYEICTKQLKKK